MTVEEIRLFVNYIANKEQSGNSLAPGEYNTLLPRAQDDFFNRMYGLFHEYQPDHPSPRVAWEVTQYVTDALKPFKVLTQLTPDGSGKVTLPGGYYHHSSLRYTCSKPGRCSDDSPTLILKNVKIIKDSEIGGITSSSIKAPTASKIYGCYYNTYIQLFPSNGTTSVDFTYLRKPATPVWGFTLVSGVPTYSSGASTQLEFPDFTHREICSIILSYMGINLREPELVQYSERLKTTGI